MRKMRVGRTANKSFILSSSKITLCYAINWKWVSSTTLIYFQIFYLIVLYQLFTLKNTYTLMRSRFSPPVMFVVCPRYIFSSIIDNCFYYKGLFLKGFGRCITLLKVPKLGLQGFLMFFVTVKLNIYLSSK